MEKGDKVKEKQSVIDKREMRKVQRILDKFRDGNQYPKNYPYSKIFRGILNHYNKILTKLDKIIIELDKL